VKSNVVPSNDDATRKKKSRREREREREREDGEESGEIQGGWQVTKSDV
jgi:hypothetical protein